MQTLKISFVLLCLLFVVNAYGACTPSQYEEYVRTYLIDLEKRQIPVFCSNFKSQDGSFVFLIKEWDSARGILIEKDDCTITNLAKVSYSNTSHQFVVEDTQGGVYSYERVDKLLQTLLKKEFILLKADDLKKILFKKK